jgi:O-antigen ligase
MQAKIEATLGKLISWALLLVTVAVTPLWSLDPINPIKLLALVSISAICFGQLLLYRSKLDLLRLKLPLVLISTFMLWQIVVFFCSSGEKLQQLFGTNGRNTGFVTYFGLSVCFVTSMVISREKYLNKFFKTALKVGSISLIYGALQSVGVDPFTWANVLSPVFGFLGNTNFQSSILGILGSIVFAQLLSDQAKKSLKIGYVAYLLVTAYVIKETLSQQGFLVLLIGVFFTLGIYVYKKNSKLGLLYLFPASIGFIGILIGTLNKGPLASILYKDSVTYRGDYWEAGWKMTLEHPFFGVGLDSYGDWYRRSRTLEATLRRGPEVTSNAAHNVFLDLSSYGGFPLLFIYIGLIALVVVSAYKVLKRSKGFNPHFVGLVAGWLAFQAQSIISINQIGLAIWGWVLAGLIIGYEINTRGSSAVIENKADKSKNNQTQNSAGSAVVVFISLVIGVLIGMPPYMASAKYKGALESQNPDIIREAAYIWPLDPLRMIQVASTLDQNNLGEQSLKISLDSVEKFPDNYGAWATLYAMKSASEEQKAQALTQMKRLDPLNPNLK